MRRAILIASANFDEDSGIEPLRFPANDVGALEHILRSDDFGFDHVSKLIDQPNNHVVERLDELMSESHFDDFILIYFSGHGKINANGELFLSCRNTKESRLNSTGLKYRHIMDLLEAHARDRVAIILDCCYAGRAVSGLKGSVAEQVTSALDTGRGIFVLGASGATQTAEERELDGHGVFTKQILDGLRSGAADIDNDGRISLNDLAKYVREELRRKKVGQEPVAAGMIRSGDLILGTNRRAVHIKTVAAARSKIEEARSHLSKGTYRAIEDYLDEVATRSDFDNLGREQKFHGLRAFAAGGSIEDVIDAFRQPIRSEPGERGEPQRDTHATSVTTPAPPQKLEARPRAVPPGHSHDAGNERATALRAVRPRRDGPPDLNNEPDLSNEDESQPTRWSTLSRPLRYAVLAVFIALSGGLISVAYYWSQDSEPVRSNELATVQKFDPADQVRNQVANAPRKTSAAVAPSIQWKLQSGFPDATATALPLFAKRVAELSGNRMRIDVLPAGAIVPPFNLLDAVGKGILELGFAPGSNWFGKNPTFTLMAAVPFGFAPRDQLGFRRRSDVAAIFDRLLEKEGAIALPCGSFGRSGEIWLNKPLLRTSDLKGAKLRFTGMPLSIYTEIGSEVVVLPAGEIIPSIRREVIAGAQFGGPANDLELGLPDFAKYYYYPGVTAPTAMIDLHVNKRRWDELPSAGQQIITQACGEAVEAMLDDYERRDKDALAEFGRRRITVAPLPDAVAQGLYAATQKLLAKYASDDDSFRALMAIVDQTPAGLKLTPIAAPPTKGQAQPQQGGKDPLNSIRQIRP